MSCSNNSESNNKRNNVKLSNEDTTYNVIYTPNLPIWTRQFPGIDPRNVRLQPNKNIAIGCVNVPKWNMQYSYGCTSCIGNDKVIFSP